MPAWKKLSSRIAHKNPWYSVREDDVIRPDGKKGKYYIVVNSSVAIVAEDKNGEIFLVGQTRYPVGNKYSWEIVTGGANDSKSPLSAAKKELLEETGVTARKWIKLGYYYPGNGHSSEKCTIFLAKDLVKGKQQLEGTEDIKAKKEKLKNIIKMIKENKIADGLTIVAIYKYLLYKYG
ncbi:MAG: NUDIX hydrolase [Patescibacteria group bacterium]